MSFVQTKKCRISIDCTNWKFGQQNINILTLTVYSHGVVMITHIETLLNYSNRFYRRQFITRKTVNHDLLYRIEKLLDEYFSNDQGLTTGLPTVDYVASQINVSPRYLSDMLRALIGQNAQQFIHEKLIFMRS